MASTLNIDVTKDLGGASQLKELLSSNFKPAFAIAAELTAYAGKPIKQAAGCNSVVVSIDGTAKWKTSTGICFSLTPTAKCTLAIGKSSSAFPVATSIRSTQTQNVSTGPVPGMVYINIDLDFDIEGNVSGTGSVDGLSISGKASGSASTTFSYCHPIDETVETVAAIKQAFSSLVFPFQPDCALAMPENSLARLNFDGCLGFQLNASYGLGSCKFSAPGLDTAKQSLQVGMDKFKLPTADLDVAATAGFSYQHTDHFAAIVTKQNSTQATLYLMRSAKNESQESAGVTAKISEGGSLAVSIDKAKLAKAVDGVTKTPGTGAKVAPVIDDLQSAMAGKANEWLCGKSTEASFTTTLSQQTNRALLYSFKLDLTKADLAKQTWIDLAQGNVAQAAQTGGMTLLPGSGVGDELKRTVCIDLHFFNFFKVTDTASYFKNSYVEVGPQGGIRFYYDIGDEDEVDTKNAMHKCRMHFVATADAGANNSVHNAEVEFYVELAESGDSNEAAKIVATIAPLGPAVKDAQAQMNAFVAANQKATLNLVCVFDPSAYKRLTSSPYVAGKPPANPQSDDRRNFDAFNMACISLLKWPFLTALSYPDWAKFNEYCNQPNTVVDSDPKIVPDRHQQGNPDAVPGGFFVNREADKLNITYCYENYADFMNLCEDLQALAGLVGKLDADQTEAEWNGVLKLLTHMVKNELKADFSKPAACALLQLCQGTPALSVLPAKDKKSFTCTVTLS